MEQKPIKIHITGMGGQGIGSTSRILAHAAKIAGVTVASMETHGLAQRGGVVVSDLAVGFDPSETPICNSGEADILIALESIEAARSLPLLRPNGIVIVNSTAYQPLTVRISHGKVPYPSLLQIREELLRRTSKVLMVSAAEDSKAIGLSQTMNVILLGALVANTTLLPFSKAQLLQAILMQVPERYHEANMLAFQKGSQYKL